MQTQYEALRAHFVEGQPEETVAERYGYSVGSFRNLCSQVRKKNRMCLTSLRRGSQDQQRNPMTRYDNGANNAF